MDWHNLSAKDALKSLKTDEKNGLSEHEAKKRLLKYGKNIIETKKKSGFLKKFFSQFNDFMIIILISAAAISFFTSFLSGDTDFIDPIVILLIVILNAILGSVQEANAEKLSDIRGAVTEIGWGNQIRSYVMQPYTMVKDHRTGQESGNVDATLDGAIDPFINAYLKWLHTGEKVSED